MAGKPPLKRLVEVRVLIPELLALATPMISDNQIVDVKEAGRHSRRHCPGSIGGPCARLKRERSRFDSEPGHRGGFV